MLEGNPTFKVGGECPLLPHSNPCRASDAYDLVVVVVVVVVVVAVVVVVVVVVVVATLLAVTRSSFQHFVIASCRVSVCDWVERCHVVCDQSVTSAQFTPNYERHPPVTELKSGGGGGGDGTPATK